MKNKFNIGTVGNMVVVDKIEGGILQQSTAGDSTILDHAFNQLTEPALRKTFSELRDSGLNRDVMLAIGELQVQLNHLLQQLASEQHSKILRLNSDLAGSVQKKSEDHQKTLISAKGLIEASQAVAGMAEPIAKSVKLILSFMGIQI